MLKLAQQDYDGLPRPLQAELLLGTLLSLLGARARVCAAATATPARRERCCPTLINAPTTFSPLPPASTAKRWLRPVRQPQADRAVARLAVSLGAEW